MSTKIRSLEELMESNYSRFQEEFHKGCDFISAAPGRINIIGEHTDYNEGLAMPAAIDRWVVITFARRTDTNINIRSLNFRSQLAFSLHHTPIISETWQKYVYGALRVFREVSEVLHGFDALIWGNVPLNAGVSSSAALEVALLNGLRAVYETNISDLSIVNLCQKIEHDYIGVQTGLLDQYASQFSRTGKVMVLDFKDLHHQYVDLEMPDLLWVLVDSKVTRVLAQSGYSQRVQETHDALKYLKERISEIHTFRDLKEEYLELLPEETWKKRLKHYLSENRRVVEAMDCIQHKNFPALGKVLLQSHQSLRDNYDVSCPELDFLVDTAQKTSCLGSRIMGGGFGGCTLNLVPVHAYRDFTERIKSSYIDRFHIEPSVEEYHITGGVFIHKF